MNIPNEIQELIPQAPFVPLVTATQEGEPHLIVVGKVKEVRAEDTLVFGIYKMENTQRNLQQTGKMQAVICSLKGGPKGYRLSGTAAAEGKEVLFKVEAIESLL